MKRLGVLLVLALCGCQTTADVENVASPAALTPAAESCSRGRLILNKYFLTPQQRADLVESLRTNGCVE